MSTVIVFVGLPGTGKSTVREYMVNELVDPENLFVYSTDDELERIAERMGKTYSEVFSDHIKEATNIANEKLRTAIKEEKTVIWDQTNLTKKKRRQILSTFKKYNHAIAIEIVPPSSGEDLKEVRKRLDGREGKNIAAHIWQDMFNKYEPVSYDEGFTSITRFDMYGERV